MNQQIQDFARSTLKAGLAKLSPANHLLFKRMYSPKNLEADINSVVDSMPVEKLDWAMQQVQRTLDKLEPK